MVEISSNFSKSEEKPTCVCGEIESMKHVYSCEIINEKTVQNGNIRKQIEISENRLKYSENLKTSWAEQSHTCDVLSDFPVDM